MKPLSIITEKNARNFIWKSIICQFGIPMVIVFDNAKQFNNDGFKLFCSDLAVANANNFSSPGHLQANDKVEVPIGQH